MFFRSKKKGLGWLPNREDARDLDIGILALPLLNFPESYSFRQSVPKILDQGTTNSCVAHAIVSAIALLEYKKISSYSLSSVLYAYYNSRKYHNGHNSDSGTYIRDCLKMISKLGIPDEKYWPFSEKTRIVNRQPNWNAYMMGNPRKDGTYVRIFDTGKNRSKTIVSALYAGFPVVFGTLISQDYLSISGHRIVDKPSSRDIIIGGHAQLIIGYKYTDDGLLFEVQNSWGEDWGDNGFVYLTEDYITWNETRDLQIIKGWKKVRPGGI